MQKFNIAALMAVAVLSTGCASILNEQTQAVNVTSSNGKPMSGSVDGKAFSAPAVVQFTRAKGDKVVTVDTPGCAKSTAVPSSVDTKFFINILSGGALGSTTDYATERMWKYADSVVVSCQ
ncbi:hypothetical protein [Roseateles sp.]|jgi:hypothetical protein|uniref:hypothetical protein n=1 Tax=Roseateles sp. TaxID=1971397 RepID=UPI00391CFA20